MIIGFVIGIHQSIYYGVLASYWLFMLSMLSFLWLNQRLKSRKEKPDQEEKKQQLDKKGHSGKQKR
jgi:hypothetical protein